MTCMAIESIVLTQMILVVNRRLFEEPDTCAELLLQLLQNNADPKNPTRIRNDSS